MIKPGPNADPKILENPAEYYEKQEIINKLVSEFDNKKPEEIKGKFLEQIKELLENNGIILNENELNSLKIPENINKNTISELINQEYINRKVKQFSKFPVATDLEKCKEILPEITKIIKTPQNTLMKLLLKENKHMSQFDMERYIENIGKAPIKPFWKGKTFIIGVIGVIIAVVAIVIFKFMGKNKEILPQTN